MHRRAATVEPEATLGISMNGICSNHLMRRNATRDAFGLCQTRAEARAYDQLPLSRHDLSALADNERSPAVYRRISLEKWTRRRVVTNEPMANTYTSLNYHIVFSTKNREPWLLESVRERLWPYLGGIARENGMKALEIGGVSDHVHVLVSIPANMPLSKAVQLIKGGSSHWIKESLPNMSGFAWQDGYGAFTVSESQLDSVQDYIRQQSEHHRTKTFTEEYRAFLEKHRIEFEERYLLG